MYHDVTICIYVCTLWEEFIMGRAMRRNHRKKSWRYKFWHPQGRPKEQPSELSLKWFPLRALIYPATICLFTGEQDFSRFPLWWSPTCSRPQLSSPKRLFPFPFVPPATCNTRQVASTPKDPELFSLSKQRAEKSLKLGRDQFVPVPSVL